jgi:SM-20-related protein
MKLFDLDAFRTAQLHREPFDHLIVPGFVRSEALDAIHADYPLIDSPGSFPVQVLSFGPIFRKVLQTIQGPEIRHLFEEKFHLDLTGRPTMVTVRGQCSQRDGRIHTDAKSKIITVLIYMNSRWEAPGGRLRLLRSPDNLEDVVAEVPPVEGTLLAFRRCDHSYHGHKPFVGQRRVIQLNWVTNRWTASRELFRHRLSAWLKRVRQAVPLLRRRAS